MDLEEKIKTIPKEIYDDVLQMCEITFMNGRSIYAHKMLPKRIIENESIWKFFIENKEEEYSAFDLQTYIALKKMIEKDKKKISDIIEELYKKWSIDEQFNYRRLTVIHEIAKFYSKEFNKEILCGVLNYFLENLDTSNNISIVESFINIAFKDLSIIIYNDWNVANIYRSTFISDILNYIGFDLLREFNKVNFRNYEIILKNKVFSKDKGIGALKDDEIIVDFKKFSDNKYLMEVLNDCGFVDRVDFIYGELKKVVMFVGENLENDFWRVLDEI